MNCRQARRMLDAQQNHPRAPLPAGEQAALRDHLAGCAGCARFARAFNEGFPALKRLPTVPPNPRALAMLDQLPTRRWEQPAILRLRWWAGRATAFAGAAFLIILVSGLITTLAQLRPQQPAVADTPVPAMAGAPPATPTTPAACPTDLPSGKTPYSAADVDALNQTIFVAAATALGLSPEQLKTAFVAGQTLEAVAAEQNVQVAQVQAAGVAAGQSYLAGAVQRGTMTQAEADKWTQGLPDFVAKTLMFQGPSDDPVKSAPANATPSAQDAALDALQQVVFAAAAGQLSLTPGQLMDELRNGAPIPDLAQTRGVSLDAIREAMRAAGQSYIDAQTANGALTADQTADLTRLLPLIVDKLTTTREPQTATKPEASCADGKPGAPGSAANVSIPFDALQAGAATALGLAPAALQAELAAGKSIATLTQERNADPAQVKAAMSRAGADYLTLAVQRGDLTQDQADELTTELPQFVDKVFQISEKGSGGEKQG
jgi:hypothetical protein